MDGEHALAAARQVERNPVRPGLVRQALERPWSSAAAHLEGRGDALIPAGGPLLSEVSGKGDRKGDILLFQEYQYVPFPPGMSREYLGGMARPARSSVGGPGPADGGEFGLGGRRAATRPAPEGGEKVECPHFLLGGMPRATRSSVGGPGTEDGGEFGLGGRRAATRPAPEGGEKVECPHFLSRPVPFLPPQGGNCSLATGFNPWTARPTPFFSLSHEPLQGRLRRDSNAPEAASQGKKEATGEITPPSTGWKPVVEPRRASGTSPPPAPGTP
jgi:hypothetical protein